jgi:multidrug efflux system outer membrane protein
MRLFKIAPFAVLLCALAGCRVGPKYARPSVAMPDAYRGLAPAADAGANSTASLGDEKWAQVFQDTVLQQLIQEALDNNKDLKIAAQRVLEQQDRLGIARAQQKPSVSGGGSYTAIGLPKSLVNELGSSKIPQNLYSGSITLSAACNLDFWGLYRSQSDAARAQLLASEWGRRETVSTIVENVVTAYFQLRTLDAELEITKKTLAARNESLHLTEVLERGGSVTLADVREAEELQHTAAAAIPDLERQIEQAENGLSILLGRNPGPIVRDASPAKWPVPEEIPAGIPSQMLERRPDIQQAEATLVAANANIGAARAQLFPQLAISAVGGTYSSQLKALVDSKNMFWLASGSLTQTIFDGGRLRSNVRLSEAQKQEEIYTYQQTIQQALRSVSDALVAVRKLRDYRAEVARVSTAADDATRLAKMRYQAGSTNYLEVLTNDTNAYTAQLNLAAAREQECISLVQLYSALGGGWQ